jgi:hypothetical protein
MSSEAARAALALLLIAGCPGGSDGECTIDAHCRDGEVCARDGSCAAPSEVRAVRTTWTVRGQPASATTCASHPDLFINFLGPGPGDTIAYSPVPCAIGQFTMDKLPLRFRQVELGPEGGPTRMVAIPTTDVVTIDLP